MFDVGKIDVTAEYTNDDLNLPEYLPDPSGSWYIVVYPVPLNNTITGASGIKLYMAESMHDTQEKLMTVGMVVRKGKMAYRWSQYKNPETGKYEDWCDVGDFVVFGRDSNARAVTFSGKKFWIMPDEAILCRCNHPNEVDPRYTFDDEHIAAMRKKAMELNSK